MAQLPDVEKLRTWLSAGGERPTSREVLSVLPEVRDLLRTLLEASDVAIVDGVVFPTGGLVRVSGVMTEVNRVVAIDPTAYVAGSRILVAPANPSVSIVLAHEAVDAPGAIQLATARDRTIEGRSVALLYLNGEGTRWVEISLEAAQASSGGVDGFVESGSSIAESTQVQAGHFWGAGVPSIQRVDTTAGAVTLSVPGGIPGSIPGRRRVALYERISGGSNVMRLQAASSISQAPAVSFNGRQQANNDAGGGINSAWVGGIKQFQLQPGEKIAWGVLLFANFKDAATRSLTLHVNGAAVDWNHSLTDAAAPSDPSVYLYHTAIGDLASVADFELRVQAGATGGCRSYWALIWQCLGADQTTPVEGWNAARHATPGTPVTTKTLSCTTTGPKRRVIYAAARRKGEQGNPPNVDGAEVMIRNSTGTTSGVENMCFASAHEEQAEAGTASAQITWPVGSDSYATWAAFAVRPAAAPGAIDLRLLGGGSALEVTEQWGRILLEYDGFANRAYARKL